MKRSTLPLFAIGLLLAVLSSSTVSALDQDPDPNYYDGDLEIADLNVDNAIINEEEDIPNDANYILLDDLEYEDDDENVGDDDNTLDIRSVNSDDLLSLPDDVLRDDLEKRSWIYKCEQLECNARCLKLLNLPQGTCGLKGKCYCKRNKK